MRVAVLHGFVPPNAPKDELDVLVQVEVVSRALGELGHEPQAVPFDLDLKEVVRNITSLKPDAVFNLVESVEGEGRLIYLAPALLDHLKIPYTGSPTEAIFITSNKLIAKERMRARRIATPDWVTNDHDSREFSPGKYIVKSIWEHASVGLDEDSIIEAGDGARVLAEMDKRRAALKGSCFAEKFVEGREFNMAILSSDSGPRVMPAAEIDFSAYPAGKVRVVGYRAKWETDSFEYHGTMPHFDFPAEDAALIEKLNKIALRCWDVFGLNGYARVDFRVDESGNPLALEINANPCLSPDAGFACAVKKAGLEFNDIVRNIINHPNV